MAKETWIAPILDFFKRYGAVKNLKASKPNNAALSLILPACEMASVTCPE
jgi:hypothetical protein